MSLMSVLVAVAISGIIAATLATLYENMNGLMVRTSTMAEVDSLMRYLQGFLSQKDLCANALRPVAGAGGANGYVRFDGTGQTLLSQVVLDARRGPVNAANPAPLVAAAVNMDVGAGYEISQIYLRNRDFNKNGLSDDPAKSSVTTLRGRRYRIYEVDLVINFTPRDRTFRVMGRSDLRRHVPLVISVGNPGDPAPPSPPNPPGTPSEDGRIVSCDYNDQFYQDTTCSATAPVAQGGCRQPPAAPNCVQIPYVVGIDAAGKAQCACREVCPPPPAPPPPTPPPGPPPPPGPRPPSPPGPPPGPDPDGRN